MSKQHSHPRVIGSQLPARGKPIVLVEGEKCAAELADLLGDRYEIVAAPQRSGLVPADLSGLGARMLTEWCETEVDMGSPVVIADQARDPLADVTLTVLAITGVLMLLSWLWWASHGGEWVAPW